MTCTVGDTTHSGCAFLLAPLPCEWRIRRSVSCSRQPVAHGAIAQIRHEAERVGDRLTSVRDADSGEPLLISEDLIDCVPGDARKYRIGAPVVGEGD